MANSNSVPADAELRSKSVTSINTLASIGFGDAEGKNKALDEDFYSAGSGEFICLEAESHCIPKDVICLLVICQKHQAIAFKQIVNDCYFLPTFQFDGDSQSLSDTVRNVVGMHDQSMLSDDFGFLPQMRLIDLYRIELIKTRSFVHRYVYQIVLTKKATNSSDKIPCICSASSHANQQPIDSLAQLNRTTNSEDTVWISLKSIPENIGNIWGGEPFSIYQELRSKIEASNLSTRVDAAQFRLTEVDSSHPRAVLGRTDWLSAMIKSVQRNLPNMFDHAVFNLYNEFAVQCFPSNSMSFSSFCILLDKLGLVVGSVNSTNTAVEPRKHLFRGLDRQLRSFIDFEDLCIGLIIFESNNDIADLPNRQQYIFRFYDLDGDGKLDQEEYKQLVIDLVSRSKIDDQLKRLNNKTKTDLIKEILEKTWKGTSLTFEQYLQAFETFNHDLNVTACWLPTVPFYEQIFLKLNCRNEPSSAVQQLVDQTIYYTRCETCSELKFSLSSSLVQLSDVGNVLKIFHLKAVAPADMNQISFAEEFQEKNIHSIANEFLIRIEKIGALGEQHSAESDEEDTAKNFFFPNRQKMMRYLHLILEYVKPLIEQDAKVLELNAPCFVFGDLNGSLKDLLRFSATVFRTFPFIDSTNLLFLGNYTDAESTANLECLIYLICMKILSPGRVFLLRGNNELAGRQQIQMQDTDRSDEPLNDIVCNLLGQIFDSFPIAAVIEDSIFASHSGIPKEFSLSHMKLVCQYGSNSGLTTTTTTRSTPLSGGRLEASNSLSSVASTEYEHLMSELLLQVVVGEPWLEGEVLQQQQQQNLTSKNSNESQFNNRDFELFISSSKLFCAVRSHQEFAEEGFQANSTFNLITLVSSTKGAKVPACLFIDYKRVRLIRFE